MSDVLKSNSVAVVGYHDGSAGQIQSWFGASTSLEISCFVIDDDGFEEVDVDFENRKRVCQLTEFPQIGRFKGCPIVTSSNWVEIVWSMGIRRVICLDPNNRRRLSHIDAARRGGFQLISAIHPSAIILPGAVIADGAWINAGCIVGYKAEVRSGVILNTGAQIDHHNVLEECCQVDPGVVTAGNVVLRKCSHIHTGAVLINRVEIGMDSIIGAGAVVLRDVPSSCTAVGVPAKILRTTGGC